MTMHTQQPDPTGLCRTLEIEYLYSDSEECRQYNFCLENPLHEDCTDDGSGSGDGSGDGSDDGSGDGSGSGSGNNSGSGSDDGSGEGSDSGSGSGSGSDDGSDDGSDNTTDSFAAGAQAIDNFVLAVVFFSVLLTM